jgi:hypothetical protein
VLARNELTIENDGVMTGASEGNRERRNALLPLVGDHIMPIQPNIKNAIGIHYFL